jgi:zinc transport system substrate-binding protein
VRARIVLTLSALLVIPAGCGSEEAGSRRPVIAAFYPLAHAAQRIAPRRDIENLTPTGGEPHDLELSPRDVERIREADTVLYFGQGFMPALEDVVEGEDNAVDLLEGERLREGHDPHLWLDPMRYAAIVHRVAIALGRRGAAEGLVADLEELDAEFRAELATCARRRIVTSHAAFGYLADAYGLEQVPLTGVSPEAEPSARAIEGLVEEVKASGATTVFFETLVSPDLAETIAREAGAETAVLNPLEGLTAEELEKGEDYFSIMRKNLAALRAALGCR